jgi:hypothetical protein
MNVFAGMIGGLGVLTAGFNLKIGVVGPAHQSTGVDVYMVVGV